jgi:hypothetical protein
VTRMILLLPKLTRCNTNSSLWPFI